MYKLHVVIHTGNDIVKIVNAKDKMQGTRTPATCAAA